MVGGALTGCRPSSQVRWEMVFTTNNGRALLTSITAESLYWGAWPRTVRIFETQARCIGAWQDHESGRLATVEESSAVGDVLRVYDPEMNLVADHPIDHADVGRVCGSPCLSPGGKRVALVGDRGRVLYADLEVTSGGEEVHRWSVWPVRDEHTGGITDRSSARRYARCYFVGEDALVVGGPPTGPRFPLYRLDLAEKRGRLLGYGYLAGVRDDGSVITGTYWAAFKITNMETGELLGVGGALHQYCYLNRVSPCSEYILYHQPEILAGHWQYIRHLKSGRRARLKIPNKWKLGSWHAVGDARDLSATAESPG